MFKKIILAVALMLPVFGASAQSLKIGLVDTNTLLQSHPDTPAAEAKLKESDKKYQEQLQQLLVEGQKLEEEFNNMPSTELAAVRERKQKQLEEQYQKVQQFQQNASQDLQRIQAELMQPIMQKISDAVESVAKEGNYSLIFVKLDQIIPYSAAPVEDITPQVKLKLGIK